MAFRQAGTTAISDIQIEKAFVFDPNESKSFAEILISTGIESPDRAGQRLLVLVATPRSPQWQRSYLETIVAAAKKSFEASVHTTPELTLESILEVENELIPELAPKKNAGWFEELSILIAISDRGQIHFSVIGSIEALLIQQTTIAPITEVADTINPLKLFTHITSGVLTAGDALVFTTHALSDYIADQKIKTLLQTYPSRIVARQLEGLLNQVPRSVTFAAVLLKFMTEVDQLAQEEAERIVPQTIRNDAPPAAAPAEQQPSPRLTPHRYANRGPRRGPFMRSVFFAGRGGRDYLIILSWIARTFIRALIAALRAIVYATERAAREREFVTMSQSAIQRLRSTIRSMPRRTQLVLALIALVLGILLHVLIFRSQDARLRGIRARTNETLLNVSTRKKAAENALIYNDEATAETIYLEIDGLLASIMPLDRTETAHVQQYRNENEIELNKVRHINAVKDPLIIADLTTLEPIAAMSADATGPIIAANKSLYRISATGDPQKIGDVDSTIHVLGKDSDSSITVVTDSQRVYTVAGQTVSEQTLPRNPDNKNIDSIALYQSNLYVADRTAATIYKYAPTAKGYAGGKVWMWNKTVLTTINSISIDSAIYGLQSNGTIIKLVRGTVAPFSYHAPSPAIGDHARIYTKPDSLLLYIADPTNKRVIIMDKNGAIREQYTSPHFGNIIDIAPDKDEKTLYVASEQKICGLAINK